MRLAIGGVNAVGSTTADSLLKLVGGGALSRTARAVCGAVAATGLVASLVVQPPAGDGPKLSGAGGYSLTALSRDLASTVLTLEPGIVGIQDFYRFTPRTLRGSFCAAPNSCQAVDYDTLPGDNYNEEGADKLLEAVRNLPADGKPVVLMGYSQGAQVIYSALRRWQAKPTSAPDPSRVSWLSIGNPDNPIGGVRNSFGNAQPRPAETPYAGTEVIRQYDGWADWPDDPSNLLAVFNAVVGMTTVHSNYFDVDINDPANVRYTPDLADGSPGNVTYVWVPNPVLPMVAGLGPLAPTLDSWLRPTVEAGYHRPVQIPAPGAKPAAVPLAAAATSSVDDVDDSETASQADSVPVRPGRERRATTTAQTRLSNQVEHSHSAATEPPAKSASSSGKPRRSR